MDDTPISWRSWFGLRCILHNCPFMADPLGAHCTIHKCTRRLTNHKSQIEQWRGITKLYEVATEQQFIILAEHSLYKKE